MKTLWKKILVGIVLFGLVAGGIIWFMQRDSGAPGQFRTAETVRGDLLVSISATGTVQPEEVVNVGAQVAGRIVSFGVDVDGAAIDYGSIVEEGMILAKIDDAIYAAELSQAGAQVQTAQAGIRRAEADLEQLRAKLRQAERDWQRAQELGSSEALSQSSYDAYQSAYETALANVAMGEAAILQAKAELVRVEEGRRKAQRNLSYCTIESPVDGIIIDRRVNIGQTVVASLNAPSLFLIAKDLTRMQVWVAVNEVDIGKIHPGQPVSFTVDAFPEETFCGEVTKVRLNAMMSQNVVTYTVEITTDNLDNRLLPYLTANVEFELDRREDVLMVPNAALRWTPSKEQIAPQFRGSLEGEGTNRDQRILWVLQGEYVRPLRVQTGLTDSVMTEVEGEELTAGMTVVTGVEVQNNNSSNSVSSPFVPQFRRGNRNSNSGDGNTRAR